MKSSSTGPLEYDIKIGFTGSNRPKAAGAAEQEPQANACKSTLGLNPLTNILQRNKWRNAEACSEVFLLCIMQTQAIHGAGGSA